MNFGIKTGVKNSQNTHRTSRHGDKCCRHKADVVPWIKPMPEGAQYVGKHRLRERGTLITDTLQPDCCLNVPVVDQAFKRRGFL